MLPGPCLFQMVRLQKFLADAGIASRRVGEQMILAGRVAVNGQTAGELDPKLTARDLRVAVDGKPVPGEAPRSIVH